LTYRPAKFAPWLITAGLLAIWQVVSILGWVDPFFLPSPMQIAKALWHAMAHERFHLDLLWTLVRVLSAVLCAAAVGIPLGLAFGFYRRAYASIEGLIHALRSVPASALFPLFLLVIGVSERAIIALAFYPSALFILVNTVTGARLANRRRLQQAQTLELSPRRIITDILFYESLPHILAGVRNAVSYALVLVVAVEMFIGLSPYGLGRRIFEYQSAYRTPPTYAAIAVAGALGILLNAFVTLLERRLLRWLPHTQEETDRRTG